VALQLPDWLQQPLSWVGLTWPEADETKLYEAAQTWLGFASTLRPIAERANHTAANVWDLNEGKAADAFESWWTADEGPQRRLADDAVAATVIGGALIVFAAATLAMKIAFIMQLATLALQVSAAIAAAAVSFGASTTVIPKLVQAVRAQCGNLLSRLVNVVQESVSALLSKAKGLLKRVAEESEKRRDGADRKVLDSLLDDLRRVNPNFDPSDPAYSANCVNVVQAYELRRRGMDVEASALPEEMWPNGGRPLSDLTGTWGRDFTDGSQADIQNAFEDAGPGSRGVVYLEWKNGGGHVFNVENVGGKVYFVDAQNNTVDASQYFKNGVNTSYVRLDDLPTPDGVVPEYATQRSTSAP
jgi:Papain fold toxin 1, glutamine deamidase